MHFSVGKCKACTLLMSMDACLPPLRRFARYVERAWRRMQRSVSFVAERPLAMELLGFQPAAYTLLGNDADGFRLSRKRTIYMLKMGAKVSNRSFGRKDAHFRGFC